MRKLITYILDYSAKLRIKKNRNVKISNSATVSAYRRICLKDGSRLNIDDNTMIQGTIVTECNEACVSIGARTFVGGSTIISANEITIGNDVLISWGCTIVDHNAHSISWSKRSNDVVDWAIGKKDWQHVAKGKIRIHNKAWIGTNVIVLKNVTIGEGAVVGAGSVVVKDVPPWTIVAGNPASIIRLIPESER